MPNSSQETAILTIADPHYGKKTRSYNTHVFERQMNALGKKIEHIRQDYLSSYDFDRLVIAILGDVNDGTDIYPTQATEQEITNVEQQADEWSEFMTSWIEGQSKVWNEVTVEAVPGNHGRAGKAAAVAANWDLVAYRYLGMKLKGKDVEVNFTDPKLGNPFIRLVKIRNFIYLLYHGHDIQSYVGIPFYGIKTRTMSWQTTERIGRFDVGLLGHFHTSFYWPINSYRILGSGTSVTGEDWPIQSLGWESTNEWWLFGASNKRAITWKFALDLEEK